MSMFKNPKNRGKLISFLIALTLVIVTTLFVNGNKKKVEQIEKNIASLDKDMEASLSFYLLGKSDLSQAQLYFTLGMMHKESGFSFNPIFIPLKDALFNSIESINEAVTEKTNKIDEFEIDNISKEFESAVINQNFDRFYSAYFKSINIIVGLNNNYKIESNSKSQKKVDLKAEKASLEVQASLLTWIAAIIGFMQLFFNSFYEMFVESKKSKLKVE